ncbi:MAG: phosphate transport system protein [Verrucomicrobiales bacterium]|jgi:phosphate transport system protein
MGAHLLSAFAESLNELRSAVLSMASVAQHNLEHAIKGLLTRDTAMCNESIAEDDDVDASEKSIDAQGHDLILRFSPVAHNLRQVLSAMKIASNLERASDQAVNIARRARKILKGPELPETREIEPIAEMALSELRDSVKSFAEGDVNLAIAIGDRDAKLDSAHKKLTKRLIASMEQKPDAIKPLLNLIFIVRCLERIGDHAVNIGEDTVFMESATDIRHTEPEAAREAVAAAQ